MRRRMGRGILGVLTGTVICLLLTIQASAIEIGQKAPEFTLQAPDGKPVKLADLLGKGPVVIFTFIQAFTGA